MGRKTMVTSVDLGTGKTSCIIADADAVDEAVELQVLGLGVAPSKGVVKGVVVNIDEAAHSIREAVGKAELQSGRKITPASISVSGSHIGSTNNRSTVAVGTGLRTVRQSDVRRASAAARRVELHGQKMLHFIPKEFVLDTNTNVKDPRGMRGFRLELEAHIVTAAQACVNNLQEAVHRAGVKANAFIPQALASAEAALTSVEMEESTLLLDIGAGTTDVAVFSGGSVERIAVYPVSGNNLTKDLAIALGVPFDVAERIKETYGDLRYNQAPLHRKAKEEDEADPDRVNLGNGFEISRNQVNEVLRSRVAEILQLALDTDRERPYTSMVLTGGTANLQGIEWLAEAISQLPVRVAAPANIYGLADKLQDPAYACSVGLLRWGFLHHTSLTDDGNGALRVLHNLKDLAQRPLTLVRR